MTTDNPYFIKGSNKDHHVITYEKGLAKPAKMTTSNITQTVMKGFGTGVGGFSNAATCLYAMAAVFDKPGHEDQYAEIMTRIKLLREIVGQEIDRIKGADKPSLPQEWRTFEKIDPSTDSPAEVTRKMRRNAMVISKKPYFFRYLYPELNQRFKQFEASYNQISRDLFGMKFKKLLKKPDKTEEEQLLVKRYQKYSPLITSPCTMNKLCREFENVDFDIQFNKDSDGQKKPAVSKLPTFESRFSRLFDQSKQDIIKKMYQDYSGRKQIKYLAAVFQSLSPEGTGAGGSLASNYAELRSSVYDMLITELQLRLPANNISGEEFLFYCHTLSREYNNFNWAFAWDVLDDQIISLIPQGESYCPVCDDAAGTTEYLGHKYSLIDITQTSDIILQNLFDTLFGHNTDDSADDIPDISLLSQLEEEYNTNDTNSTNNQNNQNVQNED